MVDDNTFPLATKGVGAIAKRAESHAEQSF